MGLDLLVEKFGVWVAYALLALVVLLLGVAVGAFVHGMRDRNACHDRGLLYHQGMCLRPDGLLEAP